MVVTLPISLLHDSR